jgi:hypothetical protein
MLVRRETLWHRTIFQGKEEIIITSNHKWESGYHLPKYNAGSRAVRSQWIQSKSISVTHFAETPVSLVSEFRTPEFLGSFRHALGCQGSFSRHSVTGSTWHWLDSTNSTRLDDKEKAWSRCQSCDEQANRAVVTACLLVVGKAIMASVYLNIQ